MAFIELNRVNYQLNIKGQQPKRLFRDLNLKLEKDRISVLVGDNGVGKTTLTKMVLGFLEPDKGSVTVDGLKSSDYNRAAMGKKVGYLFQNPSLQLFNATVEEELLFAYEVQGLVTEEVRQRCCSVIERLSLEDTLKTPVFHLSQGEKQRLAIGTLLMNDPDYLILDEPTSGLDSDRKAMLKSILIDLKEKGIGMLIITHDLGFIEGLSAEVCTMTEGKVAYEV